MSLDIYFYTTDKKGKRKPVVDFNITNNLTKMASALGCYDAVWCGVGIAKAGDMLPIVENAIWKLLENPKEYRQYDASNGWGTTEQFVAFLIDLKFSIKKYPDAKVEFSR